MATEDVPVLIVGGSLVGLSTALFLADRGVPSLVVERHRGTAIHPRAALVSQRSIETYRALGLQPEIEEAAAREFVQNGAIVSVESLGGRELDWYFREINEDVQGISPAPRIFFTQIGLEPILLRHAQERGARIEYSAECVSVEQDGNGATAVVRPRDGGRDRTVRARYIVAADGPRSPVRERLGIPLAGHGSFSDSITIYFRADVRALMGDRNLSVIYVFHPRLVGFFRFSIDLQSGFLVVNATIDEDGTRSVRIADDMSDETCTRYVREALGAPELPIEIENVQRWSASADWAERFRHGRVFVAGDAAHVMPPTGGFGGNTGIQDGYDLAWKLAYVLDGTAPEELLASYDAERRPAAELAVEQAYARYVLRLDPALGTEDLVPLVTEATVELGYRYRSANVTLEPDDDGAQWEDPRTPSGRPGFRAPHLAVRRDGRELSLLDLFGDGFVLLAGRAGEAWTAAAVEAARRAGAPLEAHRVGQDVDDPTGRFEDLYGTGAAGATLVRPDGFVAWRAREAATAPEDELAAALARALGRPPM